MKVRIKLLTLLFTLLFLAGCAQTRPPIKIAIDTYCQSTKKIRWSIHDDPRAIDDARRHNAAWDKRCFRKK